MPSVFFSYSRNDLALIKELETQLKAQPKISIWRDQQKIYGGQKWTKVLGEAIADQEVVLLAWSKRAAASYFVEFEWTTAIALKKRIVPCPMDHTPLPASLAAIHAISVDDLPKIVTALTGVGLVEDRGRRTEVVSTLGQITTTKLNEELEAVGGFDPRGWTVLGNVIQAQTVHMHYHSDPSKSSNGAAREGYLKGRVLGNVLRDQGIRTGGEDGKEPIRQAISAYELALQINTRDALPVQWEKTMDNLKTAKKALEEMQ
jgi:hypothetical protein